MKEKYKDLRSACKNRKYLHIKDRLLAVHAVLVQNHTKVLVGKIFQVTERTVYNWVEQYKKDGIAGLEDRPGRGRKKDLSDKKFKKTLKSLGDTTPLKVQQAIAKKHKIDYSLNTIRYKMRNFNYSVKTVQTFYAHRATIDDINYMRNAYRRVISRLRNLGYHICVMDESIVTEATLKGIKLWSKKNQPIFVPTKSSRKKIVIYGVIGENNMQYFEMRDKTNKEQMMEFIDGYSEEYGKSVWLLDSATWHTSEEVQKYAKKKGITMIFLPTAVPELSAIEEFWHQLKREIKVGVYYETFEDLKDAVSDYLKKTSHGLDIMEFFNREITA